MEGGGSERKKKMSFGFSSSHEKIKLIDILSEDDDFLVASPFFDSHQGTTPSILYSLYCSRISVLCDFDFWVLWFICV